MELLQSQLQPRPIAMELLLDVPMLLLAATVLHPNRLLLPLQVMELLPNRQLLLLVPTELLPLIAMELHPLQDISLKLLSLDHLYTEAKSD